jgi:hypothetical protein
MSHMERRRPETRKGDPRQGRPITLPPISSFNVDLSTTEQRECHLWGEALLRSLEAWRHIQSRRREGAGGRP